MKNDKGYPDTPWPEENRPRITLILPFESKMAEKNELFDLLTLSADRIEKDLRVHYSEERATPVIKKLRHLIAGLHHVPKDKSIAILVSPLTENVFFFTSTRKLKNPLLSFDTCV